MISGLYQIVWIHGSVLILCSCPGKDQHFCFLFGHLLSLTKIAVRIADIQIVPNHDQNLIFPLDLPSISRDFYVSLSCWCLYITISFSFCQLFSENLFVFLLLSVRRREAASRQPGTNLSFSCIPFCFRTPQKVLTKSGKHSSDSLNQLFGDKNGSSDNRPTGPEPEAPHASVHFPCRLCHLLLLERSIII